MNSVNLIGRLTADPTIRYTQSNEPMAIASYTLAVDRPVKKEGQQNADFIRCIAFGKVGELASKHLFKGTKIAVSGRIQTGSYDKDGVKHYTTDVVVNSHYFCESKNSNGFVRPEPMPETAPEGFEAIDDDDMPF